MAKQNAFARPLFFDRQSLDAEDLNALVDWIRAGQHRFNRHAIGSGVLCGLQVRPVAGQSWQVQIGPGYAIAPSGAEIEVPTGAEPFDTCPEARVCLEIPGPCPNPEDLTTGQSGPLVPRNVNFADGSQPQEGLNPRDLGWIVLRQILNSSGKSKIVDLNGVTGLSVDQVIALELQKETSQIDIVVSHSGTQPTLIAMDGSGNEVDRQKATVQSNTPQMISMQGDGIQSIQITAEADPFVLVSISVEDPPLGEVFLALCPDETPACPKPGVPEACQQPDAHMQFSRICEGFRLRILCDLPDDLAPLNCDDVEQLICNPVHIPCPDVDSDCVILATLQISQTGIVGIDEFEHRRRLPPVWLQAQRHACQCGEAPAPTTPPPSDPPSVFTDIFTTATLATNATLFTRNTLFTDLTLATQPDTFSDFSIITGGVGPGIERPSDLVNPGGGGLVFDRTMGLTQPVTAVAGIGRVRSALLETIGIDNLTSFIEGSSEEISSSLNVSEVKVAEMQDQARALLRDGGPR